MLVSTPRVAQLNVRQLQRGLWLVAVVGLALALVSGLLVGGARSASQASGLIAFVRDDGIYVMRADGSGARRITRTGQAALYGGVAWSPDGSKLVFATWDDIWVMDAEGRDPVRLGHRWRDQEFRLTHLVA